ncbi:hypothetical protein QP794_27140 [Paenibacillus sp. UMB7766-LJ446]|uniref:hypothetical protein n=1 Tax=Paenibacillus sp. UMB7766-LJ446 TaxID=3046313 RepID=UPI00254DB05A|nr:hypothetical protein [Paenibacillus sp. UMB7766-LJ446]MDK8193762.1 hypothetical protein [Paenibacillus sp. UMB7766-LJ446]
MSVLLVSYDLNKSDKDYNGLYEVLKSFGYCHYLDSTWLISTELTPTELYNRLSSHIDENDFCLVIKVTSEYYGWLPTEAWDWLKQALG